MSTITIGKPKRKKKKSTVKIYDPNNPEEFVPRAPGAMKYSDQVIFDAYEAARTGVSQEGIRALLKITADTFYDWMRKYPLFALAIKRGREYGKKADGSEETFREYVYQQLDPKLKAIWDEVNACQKEKNSIARLEALFENHGTKARQHLFLYALTASNFNASRALKRVGLSHGRLRSWVENDPDFAKLYQEIEWHKGNFFESGLIGRVKEGDTGAIIFANRTFNKDRGYGIKNEIQVSGTIHHEHTVDIEGLELSLEVRRALLDAIEKQEEKMNGIGKQLQIGQDDNSDAIDAELVEKDDE